MQVIGFVAYWLFNVRIWSRPLVYKCIDAGEEEKLSWSRTVEKGTTAIFPDAQQRDAFQLWLSRALRMLKYRL